ncbi:serine/threonine-protein kinase [Kitasatospora sp. NPDC096140]|uniref:serine/threonine-protein kinase n=1 Tax=Kitasatospora sp. NPDC096140 TaxID=3155425 RepID=UPI003321CE4E
MDDRTQQGDRPGGGGTPSTAPGEAPRAEDDRVDEAGVDEAGVDETRAEDSQTEQTAESAEARPEEPQVEKPQVEDARPEDARGAWELPGYLHDRELGAGASGRVVLAHHLETGTPVAIKYLHDRVGTPALRAEAEVLARIDSPHITRLYEYVEGARGSAIVMELVDGIALRDLLRAEGATSAQAALVVLKGSLLGLAAAHEAGVVHRDYKPANVLVDTAGTSKLVDFGIAVPSGDDRDVSGTPAYMPPEQWAGRPASPAGDVYAATVTFFECLTGARPFEGATIAELAVQHAEAPIPAELAPDLVRPLILAGLAKDPEARPDSAAAFVRELEAVATTGYGPGWEERGRLDLLGLLALLAPLLPGAGAAGATSLAHTSVGSQSSLGFLESLGSQGAVSALGTQGAAPAAQQIPHPVPPGRGVLRRNRGKALTGVAAGALTLATLAGLAAAGATDGGARTVVGAASPEATTSIDPQTPTDGVASPTPSGDGSTPSPTASTPAPTASPTATPSTPGSTPTATPTTKAPTAPATPGRPAPGGPPAPSTPGAPAPTTAAPAPPPVTAPPSPSPSPTVAPATLTVDSVSLAPVTCSGRWSLTATATVTARGTGSGTLTFSWYHSSGGRAVTVATDTVPVVNGTATISRAHDFGSADTFPTWGVRVTTTPAAGKAGTTSSETSAFLCNPPR